MYRSTFLGIFLFVAGSIAMPASADQLCYTQHAYPLVDFLAPAEGGVTFLTQPVGVDNTRGGPYFLQRMTGNVDGFARTGEVQCEWGRCEGAERLDACPDDMPEITIAEEDVPAHLMERWNGNYMPEYLQQQPSACATVGDEVYFGLGFYGGEGLMGLGGVGRWNRKTGELEVRHPKLLQNVSVNHMAFDGQHFWLGTYYDSECSGESPEKRVLVYDWERERFEPGQGIRFPLTCGFIANAFLQTAPNVMWVASDMGVSRVTFQRREDSRYWGDKLLYGQDHWWAVETPEGIKMQKGNCDDLHASLLGELPITPIPTYKSVLSQFIGSLRRFNGSLVQRDYERRILQERGVEKISFQFRNVAGRVLAQACQSGELFLPQGDGWWWAALEQRDPTDFTAPDTAVKKVMTGWVESRPAPDGEQHRELHYVKRAGSSEPTGACAGATP